MRYGDVFVLAFVLGLVRWAIMGYVAWHDAKTRTFPNGLAVTLILICVVEAFTRGGLTDLTMPDGTGGLQEGGFIVALGVRALVRNLIAANIVFAALYVFELLWRRFRKTPGLGMGDLKFLFALMISEPVKALLAFTLGLVALAITGIATRKQSLPLLPFVVGAYFAILLASLIITLGM